MLENYVDQVEREKNRIFNIAKTKYHIKEKIIEDIYQDTFLGLLKGGIKSYDTNREFLPWFIKCFLNKCIDYLRGKRNKVEEMMFSDFEDIDKIKSLDYKSLENITDYESLRNGLTEEFLNDLKKIIDRLKPDYRDLIKMYYWRGLKYNEIAGKLNIPIGTVKSRLNVARRDLKKLLTEDNKIAT